MRGKSLIGVAALGLVLSAGMLAPAGAAAPEGMSGVSFKGLIASADGMTEEGGRLTVQGLEGGQMIRERGSKPVKEDMISGLVAFTVEGPFDDYPDVLVREVWCIAEGDDAFTIDRKLTAASLEFDCDAMFVDVVCTEWVEDECQMGEEFLNEDLTDRISVNVEWTGVGGLMRDMSVTKSSGDDFWWLSHTRLIHRAATATGTIESVSKGMIFNGEFGMGDEFGPGAEMANVRDGSIQRGDMEM